MKHVVRAPAHRRRTSGPASTAPRRRSTSGTSSASRTGERTAPPGRDRGRGRRRAAARRADTSRCAHSRSSRRVEGHSFRFVNRIPLERGLGSSAATIAAGLVAGAAVAGRDASPTSCSSSACRSRATPTTSRRRSCGGVCLIWQNGAGPHTRRASPTDLPLAPIVVVPARAREHEASRGRLPEHRLARRGGRGRARRRRCSAPPSPRATPSCSPPPSTTALHEPYRVDDAPLLAELRDDPVDRPAGVTLSGSGPSVVVWAEKDDAAAVADALRRRVSRTRSVLPLRIADQGAHLMSVYDQPTDPAKRRSAALTDGVDRAPRPRDAEGASASPTRTSPSRSSASRRRWIETMPCNLNQRVLAHARQGRASAPRAARRSSSTRSPSPTASRWGRPACARR